MRHIGPVLLTLALAGCASRGGTVKITSLDRGKNFAQNFNRGYSSRADDGTYDIVLVQEPLQSDPKPGAPLKPSLGEATRQIVHIRLLWKAMTTGRADAPTAAANATIDWFVMSENASQQSSMLHYRGGGLVAVDGSRDHPKITIRAGTIRPVVAAGGAADPIGTSQLTGKITTTRDPQRVQIILEDLHSTATASAH